MQGQSSFDPWWAALTVWGVVNAVNILQAAGFLSRVVTGSMTINHFLGYIMMALVVPATLALVAFWRAKAGGLHLIGPVVYIVFIVLMLLVDYVWQIEFRESIRHSILVPYLLLFFGAILLMGLPMFQLDKRLWLVTVATTILLLSTLVVAKRKGVG
jgi:hypothetical protein